MTMRPHQRPRPSRPRTALVSLSILLLASAVQAQTADSTLRQRWLPFNDSIGQVLRLTPEQLGRATQVDLRLRKQYDAMGNTPWTDPRYPSLQDQRNMEVRGILDQDQYKQWLEIDRPVTPSERAIPAPPPPPPDPQR